MRPARLTHRASHFAFYVSLFATVVVLLASASVALAQVSSNYDLSWHVVAGGGGRMESARYTLQGTAGQPAVGMTDGSGHDLCSGFWCGILAEYRVYLPLVLRNAP